MAAGRPAMAAVQEFCAAKPSLHGRRAASARAGYLGRAMYILGHVGLTALGARLADERVDLRAAAALALLPDLIDKPFEALLPSLVNGNTRGFGHTLLGALVVLAALRALGARRPLLLWGCYVGHFALDLVQPAVLLWPLLGDFPPPVSDIWTARRLWRYNLAGEGAGAAALGLMLLWRLLRRAG